MGWHYKIILTCNGGIYFDSITSFSKNTPYRTEKGAMSYGNNHLNALRLNPNEYHVEPYEKVKYKH